MRSPYEAVRPSLRSGDVIAFRRDGRNASYQVSLYSHVALAWVVGGRVLLLETDETSGIRISVGSNRFAGHRCDLIRTKVAWTDSLEHWALAPVGRGFPYLAPVLASLGFNVRHGGDPASLYVAAVLRRAGVHLSEHGYTAQALVDDLISLGDQIQRLDCQAVADPGLSRIQILNSQGSPMTTASIPRDNLDTFALSFLSASGLPVGVPAGVEVASSDPSIATVAIVTGTSDSIVVTPVTNGSATITVTSGTVSASLDVSIVDPPLASIVIGEGTLSPIVAPVAPVDPAAPVVGS